MENQETKQIKEIGSFKSSYLLRVINGSKINNDADNIDNILKTSDFNPFRGIHLRLTDQSIEYKRRTWYLFGVEKTQFNWQNVVGITIDKHLFGCHIKIMSAGGVLSFMDFLKIKPIKFIRYHQNIFHYILKNQQQTYYLNPL